MTPLRQYVSAALLGACLALCAAHASAEEAPDASLKGPSWLAHSSVPKVARPVASGASVGVGRSAAVLLLTAILGGAALYLRMRKSKPIQARLGQLRVLGSTKLGGRAQLVLAEVAGRKILLGVTDSSVRKLGWLEAEAAEEDELYAEAPRPRLVPAGTDLAARPARAAREPELAQPKRSFRDLLANAVGNIGRPADDSAADMLAAETQDTFTRSTPRPATRSEATRHPVAKGGPQMLDVEGQARGLLARLGEPRA